MNKFKALIIMLFLISISGCVYFSGIQPEQKKQSDFIPKIVYESLQFYTADENGLERSFRVYNEKFGINSVDWIWYELIIKNSSERDGKIFFVEVWSDGNGKVISRTEKDMSLRAKDKFLEYTAGIKTEWQPGYYELRLYQDSLEITGREFQIVN